jgi:uncharacterized protein
VTFLTLIASAGLALGAQISVPANTGWVTDNAQILSSSERQQLELLMESYRSGTTHEIALLTIESLEGESLEAFALETARSWGLGGKNANNGALLLISKGDRKIRIEVGRGLEGTLTDSVSGRIVREIIRPQFKRGRLATGIEDGLRAMHAAIGGDYGPLERTRSRRKSGGAFAGLIFLLIFIMIARRGSRGGGGRGGGMGSIWTWLMLDAALRSGNRSHSSGWSSGGSGGFGGGGGGFGGFGGGGGFSGGGASGGW